MHPSIHLCIALSTLSLLVGLTIGAEQSFYSIKEDEGSLEICIDVLLGTIPSDESYTINYITANGAAEGIYI